MMPQLVLMVKAPRMGQVKTRLGREIGSVAATHFARSRIQTLARQMRDPRWQTRLAVSPDVDDWPWPSALPLQGQGAGDLGARMQRVFDLASPGPVIIIGADIPAITKDHIAQGFRLLGSNQVVFGPAPDGGYWLVGQRRLPKTYQLFEGVRWSHEHTLKDTLANAAGLKVGFLPELEDVDDAKSYEAWRKS